MTAMVAKKIVKTRLFELPLLLLLAQIFRINLNGVRPLLRYSSPLWFGKKYNTTTLPNQAKKGSQPTAVKID